MVVEESEEVRCGAVVAHDEEVTVIVFHPSLNEQAREEYAQMLLTEGEMRLWQEQQPAVG